MARWTYYLLPTFLFCWLAKRRCELIQVGDLQYADAGNGVLVQVR